MLDRCLGGSIYNEYIGDEACYPFSEPREFTGIFVFGFEWSEFYPNAQTYEETEKTEPKYWLEFGKGASWSEREDQTQCTHDCAFRVSFVGRQSLCAAGYGHLNSYPHKIIVERVISASQIALSDSDA